MTLRDDPTPDWIDVREAWARIAAAVRPLGTESIDLDAATGRVLRVPVSVDRDLPPFDRAAMDGFAIRAFSSTDKCACSCCAMASAISL